MGETHAEDPTVAVADSYGCACDALREQADGIARVAAALCPGDDAFASATQHVADLASHLCDTDSSQSNGDLPLATSTEQAETARRLRIVEAFCIETIRHALPVADSRIVIARLRDRARDLIPKPPVSPEDFQFFEQFLEPTQNVVPGEHARANAFVHTVMSGLEEMVYVHDLNGSMLYVNKRAMAITGFDRDDYYAGLSIYDIVAPESLRVVESRLQSPHQAPWSPATINVLTKDGSRACIAFHTRPFIENGQLTAIIGMGCKVEVAPVEDVRLRPMGFMLLDRKGTILEVSKELVSLIAADDREVLIGVPFTDMVAAVPGAEPLDRVLETGTTVANDVLVHGRDGTKFTWRIDGVRHDSDDDSALWFITVYSRVGEESPAGPSENMLASVLAVAKGVAHELNNPLTGIWGQAQRLLELPNDEEQRKRIDQIVQEAGRCRRIMEGLLGFARSEFSGFDRIALGPIVENVTHMMRYQIEADGVEFIVDIDPDADEIVGDLEALRSVIRHLVHNAHLAARDSSLSEVHRVKVVVRSTEHETLLEVTDSGQGVSPDIQNHVFTPFYTTRPIGEGVGMGLSICYGIINEHGGKISVANAAEGGAVFTVRLPKAKR